MRDTIRGFIDKEVRPNLDALETGEIPPYPIARKLFSEFGLDVLAAEAVKTMLDNERAKQEKQETEERSSGGFGGLGAQASMAAVLVSELAGVSLGLLSTVGVSLGLGAATIMSRGTLAQKERWLPELMTLEKIAAWAITEPDAGSDAFGGMKTYVKRDGDDYLLNGQKTFITNGPFADVLVVYAKLDDGQSDRSAQGGVRRTAGATGRQPSSVLLRCARWTVLWLQPARCETLSGSDLELVAPGHDGRHQGALRRHRRVLPDRLHRRPEEDHCASPGDA